MAQAVAEIVPRVRRAIEGPRPLVDADPLKLTNEMIEATAADAIGDLILYTVGRWPHTLAKTGTDPDTGMDSFSVDPALEVEEEGLVAAQAALTYFFHAFKEKKVHETLTNEGQTWDWDISPAMMRDQFKMLREQRDLMLEALKAEFPVMARAASLFHLIDRQTDAVLSGYMRDGGTGGGLELDAGSFWPGPLNQNRG